VSRVEPTRIAVDLSQMAMGIAEELRSTDMARSTTFRIEKNITVMGDPILLRIVMQNLLGNAWKYTGKQTEAEIRFGAMKQDHEQVLFVQDNGAGFEKENAGRIFAAFQRLHTDKEFEGPASASPR